MKYLISAVLLLFSFSVFASRCPDPEDFNCNQPSSCQTPWRITLQHGESMSAYAKSSVHSPEQCQGEVRTCVDGTLTGSYTELSCTVYPGRDDFE